MPVAIGRAAIAIFTLLTIASPLWPDQEPSAPALAGHHRIQFQAHNGTILIPGHVNGNHATFLVDTGAALTTFSLKAVPSMDTSSRITIHTANGSITAFRVPVGFNLGELAPRSFRQSVVVGDFKFGEADGVIGLDVLSSFKAVTVDFQNSVLILVDR